jgi:hypothetical protein
MMEFENISKLYSSVSAERRAEISDSVQLELNLIDVLKHRNTSRDKSEILVLIPKWVIESLISKFDKMDPPTWEDYDRWVRPTSEYGEVEALINNLRGAMEILDNEAGV